MSVSTFKASHCGEAFEGLEGAKALEAHMLEAHGHKALVAGSTNNQPGYGLRYRTAAGWSGGKIQPPIPWVAPKASPAKLAKVTADILAGKYELNREPMAEVVAA
jgi:hypothetical protein